MSFHEVSLRTSLARTLFIHIWIIIQFPKHSCHKFFGCTIHVLLVLVHLINTLLHSGANGSDLVWVHADTNLISKCDIQQ